MRHAMSSLRDFPFLLRFPSTSVLGYFFAVPDGTAPSKLGKGNAFYRNRACEPWYHLASQDGSDSVTFGSSRLSLSYLALPLWSPKQTTFLLLHLNRGAELSSMATMQHSGNITRLILRGRPKADLNLLRLGKRSSLG